MKVEFPYPVKLQGNSGKRSGPGAPKDRYAWACNVVGRGKFVVNESASRNKEDWITTYYFADEKDAMMFSLLWLE
jgi:hypothetical protein